MLCPHMLLRHTSVNTAINLNHGAPSPSYDNPRVLGNIAERATACFGGGVRDPSDAGGGAPPCVRASDRGDLDYHLTGGVAVDQVPVSVSNLLDDIDGQPRPNGPALDAGSDER